jgi:hypothetical protein
LEFLSLKVAFYPETKQFMERGSLPGPVGAQLPLFLPIESQSDKSPEFPHFIPEIDFCPDTLESSHAYLKPSAVWAPDLRR